MGNAYVAVADDFNALFYNPAGLARLNEWDGEFINLALELSQDTRNFYDDLTDTQGTSQSDQESLESTLDLIDNNTGRDQHIGFGLTPHLVFPHFGIGMGFQFDLTAAWHRQITVDLRVGPDVVMPIGFAMNFLDDRLSVGGSIKFRARGGIDQEFSMEDIESLNSNNDSDDPNQKELEDYVFAGSGVGADIGLLFTPIKPMAPTIGLSITDMGGTSFTKFDTGSDTEVGTPDLVLPSVNVGLSLRPIEVGGMYLMTSMDMHSINQPYSFSRKLNLGTEFGYGSFFKAQAGLHQGYLSAGVQLDVGLLSLRFVSYAVEFGEYAGTKENRRYAVQLKLLL
jgi:hypothetical protein